MAPVRLLLLLLVVVVCSNTCVRVQGVLPTREELTTYQRQLWHDGNELLENMTLSHINIAQVDAYLRAFIVRIETHYLVAAGSLHLYHGNIINYGNMEEHALRNPTQLLRQRVYDLAYSKRSTIRVYLACENPLYDAEIVVKESDHNAPVEYNFYLQLKARYDHHFHLPLVAEVPDLLLV